MTEQEKQKEFLDMYKELCSEYGMYINLACGEGSYGDMRVEIETVLSEDELPRHFKEIENNS